MRSDSALASHFLEGPTTQACLRCLENTRNVVLPDVKLAALQPGSLFPVELLPSVPLLQEDTEGRERLCCELPWLQ